MERLVPLLLLLLVTLLADVATSSKAPHRTVPSAARRAATASVVVNNPKRRITATRYDRFVQNIFDNADANGDGTISMQEVYELVLRFYIQVNRQAPINPPTRQTVHEVFSVSDTNQNHRISRDEFTQLAQLLGKRAVTRIVTFKLINVVLAPILAMQLVHWWPANQTSWLPKLVARIVPERFVSTVISPAFARTVVIVVLVSTLGQAIMGIVDFWLEWSLPKGQQRGWFGRRRGLPNK